MPKIKIPALLRPYTDGLKEVDVEAENVNAALDSLRKLYPNLGKNLYNNEGKLHTFVNISLGDIHIKELKGLETPLKKEDRIQIIPSISGG